MKRLISLFTLLMCSTLAQGKDITPRLQVPDGFSLTLFADKVENARQLAVSPKGIVYVGSRKAGNVYALIDENHDGRAERQVLIASGLEMPSGVAYKDGVLYVAEVSRILKFADIDSKLDKAKAEVVFDKFPTERHHGWKVLGFTPDGELIVPVGVPCNICPENDKYGRLFALNLETKQLRTLAMGVRNSVGFDYNPVSQKLWFSDNGRDMMGDDIPPCEINRIDKPGEHFGFPFVHAGAIPDPEYGKGVDISKYKAPALSLGAHVAPLGIHFYRGSNFPDEYKYRLLVAEHGSWNRTKKAGYRVMLADIKDGNVVSYSPFVTGFMENEETFGRPVAFAELADGSVLISDDYANAIYRVSYNKN